MKAWTTGEDALRARLQQPRPANRAAAAEETAPLPPFVADRLAELRLLHDVPFSHLVADSRLLPPESLRFFHLDTAWTDALTEGALAAGAGGTREASHLAAHVGAAQAAADAAMPAVRDRRLQRTAATAATADDDAGPITGLLFRSAAVTQWPSMQVRAYSGAIAPEQDPDSVPGAVRLELRRLERLGPSVLLALFAGVPSLVVLEEPHDGVRLGLAAEPDGGWTLALRGGDGTLVEAGGEAVRVDVPLRAGAEALGVVDVAALAQAVGAAGALHPQVPRPIGPAVFGLQLIRAPWRQRFEAPGNA